MRFKNIISYLSVAIIMCFVVSAAVYSGTITKGKLTKSDIALWTGTSSTEWERETSTGYNLVLPYFDYMGVDVLETYGGNVNANKATLQAALDAIETSNERLLWMAPTTWDIDDDITIPANVTMQVPPGCTLAIANGKDLYFAEDGRQIQAGNYQIFDTTAGGTVTIASAIMEHDMWRDGSGVDWYAASDNTVDVGVEGNKIKKVATYKISGHPFPGYVARARFEWKDADEIYIWPGTYYFAGTKERLLYWDSSMAYQFTDITGGLHYQYLCFDSSAIDTADTNLITVTEFTASSTTPTYSEESRGYYIGADKVIFGLVTEAGSTAEFFHDGGDYLSYADTVFDVSTQDVDNAWVDAESALTIPAFATRAQVLFTITYIDKVGFLWWRTKGQTADTGHAVMYVSGESNTYPYSTVDVFTNSAQLIQLKLGNVGSDNTVSAWSHGWYFPNGM